MSDIITPIIVAIIVAIPGMYAAIAQIRSNRINVVDKQDEIISRQADELSELRQRVTTLEHDRDLERAYIRYLISLMRANDIQPITLDQFKAERAA